MKIAIIGATGRVGKLLINEALKKITKLLQLLEMLVN